MARIDHRYDNPERFVAGTVGVPGERTFFIQAREGSRLSSVVCEKQQVAVLAEHLDKVLNDIARLSPDRRLVPAQRSSARDIDPLEAPITEDFRVGTIRLAWDTASSRMQIELYSVDDTDEDTESTDDEVAGAEEALIVSITPDMARDFAARAQALVSAGRPPCPFCMQPLSAEGHICPRANGYRRPLFA